MEPERASTQRFELSPANSRWNHGSSGFPFSAATRLVAMICKEKEIPYEPVPINLPAGEHKTPKHLQFHPRGLVPYINDDGFILYESRAIARYLIKYPNQGTPGLVPSDPKEEALFEQASSIEAFNFHTQLTPLAAEKVFNKFRGLEPDPVKVEEYTKKAGTTLDVYHTILGRQKYLAGDHVTLADLQHVPIGSALCLTDLKEALFEKGPNLHRWWQDIYNRPSWQAIKERA